MNLVTLVDEYLGEVARLHTATCHDKYRRILQKLLIDLGEKTPIDQITESDLLRSLSRWSQRSKSTQYLSIQIYGNVFAYAVKKRHLENSPAQHIERPRRPRPEDTEVTAVSREEVARMFFYCENWGDEICLGVLAYTGSRRNAVSQIRWKDVDLRPDPPHGPYGWIKFYEKGGKFAEKPIPFLLRQILDRAPIHDKDDYLVPNYRPGAVTRRERSNKIIWTRVKNIAARAGVEAHVHAIRAAFAVNFLEANRGNIKGLQDLLGHSNIQTTQTYLRKFSKKESMAGVVDLSYGALNGSDVSRASSNQKTGEDGPAGNEGLASLPLSALSEGQLTGGLRAEGWFTEREYLALCWHDGEDLSFGEMGRRWLVTRERARAIYRNAVQKIEARYPTRPVPMWDGLMTRHEEVTEPEEPQTQLPSRFEKAHTGFEPVNSAQPCNHVLRIGARHGLGHVRRSSAIVGHGS